MKEDINKLIEELTIVRPDELSIEGLKLFNKINEIIDKNKELEENSIPVSLVEETIEEYTKLLKNCNRFSDVDRIKAINERILAYKELLEKR